MSAEPASTPADLNRSITRSFALHSAALALEAAAVGWVACACVLAAVFVSAPQADPGQAWIAAGIALLACGGGWWLEHAPERAGHVRSVDRRLGFEGALVTADGIRALPAGASLSSALVARVAARLTRADLVRASLPRTPLAIVAVLSGAAVLLAVRDVTTPGVPPEFARDSADSEALGAAAGALRAAAARSSVSGAMDGTSRACGDLAAVLEEVARHPGNLAGARPALEQRLLDAARDPRLGPDALRAVAQALSALDRAVAQGTASGSGLERPRDPASTAHQPGPPTAAPTGPSISGASNSPGATPGRQGSEIPGAGGASQSSGAVLASVGSDGRMVPPQPDGGGRSGSDTSVAAGEGAERGVGAIRWWPARYDDVVQSWLEPTRAPKHE